MVPKTLSCGIVLQIMHLSPAVKNLLILYLRMELFDEVSTLQTPLPRVALAFWADPTESNVLQEE